MEWAVIGPLGQPKEGSTQTIKGKGTEENGIEDQNRRICLPLSLRSGTARTLASVLAILPRIPWFSPSHL